VTVAVLLAGAGVPSVDEELRMLVAGNLAAAVCVVDRRMNRNEALSRFGRFEALHLSFSSSNLLMGILRTVVGTQSLLMPSRETKFAKQYALIEPWPQTDQPPPDRERRQSPEERAELDGFWECILCF
jgi:hypothetical protein